MPDSPGLTRVSDNRALNRFELVEGGLTAIADYRRSDAGLQITHVEAPPALRGTGAAGRLMAGLVQLAEAEGVRIVPLCSYAAAYMRRHPQSPPHDRPA